MNFFKPCLVFNYRHSCALASESVWQRLEVSRHYSSRTVSSLYCEEIETTHIRSRSKSIIFKPFFPKEIGRNTSSSWIQHGLRRGGWAKHRTHYFHCLIEKQLYFLLALLNFVSKGFELNGNDVLKYWRNFRNKYFHIWKGMELK